MDTLLILRLIGSLNSFDLKALKAELIDGSERGRIVDEYMEAIERDDHYKLNYFASMGRDVRQQVMNVNDYRRGLHFGMTAVKFNEYGWLDNVEWKVYEKIPIKVCNKRDKHFTRNEIRIAQGQNGVWTFGVSYQLGSGAGGGWIPSVYDKAFETKEEAFKAGAEYLYEKHQGALKTHDPSNYDHAYNNKIIKWLNENVFKK